MATKAELESANQELVLELERAKSAMKNLKQEVVEKARDLAQEHGWCGVVDDALDDLGLTVSKKMVLELTIKVPVVITSEDEIDAEDLATSISWGGSSAYWKGAYMPDVEEMEIEGVRTDQDGTTSYVATLVSR